MVVVMIVGLAAGVMNLVYASKTLALTLSTDGKTEYIITLAKDATLPEQTAAKELQTYLKEVTGAFFPIFSEDASAPENKQIVVGQSLGFQKAMPEVNLASLKSDGIVIKTVGNNLYLAGGRPRGTLYAVYTFLEDIVGCQWWTSKESFIPKIATLKIPKLNKIYIPKLQYREAYYRDVINNPIFAARLKCNGHSENIPIEYGGNIQFAGFVHTFYQLLPPQKYFKEHPEWYSEIGGERVSENVQLCLTNEEMRAELTHQALNWLRDNPKAGIISISQNDCGGQCECGKCKSLEAEYGSPSGAIVYFVNSVAEEIEKEFPDVFVETLAYSYTRTPPVNIKPRRNVIIRLCSIECDFSHTLNSKYNKSFINDIKTWRELAPQLFIWDYVTNFANYILPHPNMRVLAPNIRTFVDNGAIGLFEQGDVGSSCGDFVEMRAWLLSHLMWNPSQDEESLINEFLIGYYGPAAGPIRKYINLVHNAVERRNIYLKCFMDSTIDWFSFNDLDRATELFNKAEQLVKDNPVLCMRVRRARLPLCHTWLISYHSFIDQISKTKRKSFLGPSNLAVFGDDFIKTCYSFDIGNFNEGKSFKDYEPQLRDLIELNIIFDKVKNNLDKMKNLIRDSSFEEIETSQLKWIKEGDTPDLNIPWFVWKDEQAKTVTPKIDEKFSHSGKKSAVISGETNAGFLQILPVKPGERYYLSCYAYTNTLGERKRLPDFEIEWRKEDTSPLDSHQYYAVTKLKAAKSWQKLQFITTVPEGAAYGLVLLMVNNESSSQKVWFDDVFVGRIE